MGAIWEAFPAPLKNTGVALVKTQAACWKDISNNISKKHNIVLEILSTERKIYSVQKFKSSFHVKSSLDSLKVRKMTKERQNWVLVIYYITFFQVILCQQNANQAFKQVWEKTLRAALKQLKSKALCWCTSSFLLWVLFAAVKERIWAQRNWTELVWRSALAFSCIYLCACLFS